MDLARLAASHHDGTRSRGLASPRMSAPRRRNLVVLVLGQTVSLLGDYLAFFLALPVFVRDRTGSATSLGLLAAVETMAVLAFGLLAGVLLDRGNMRRSIVFADLARAAAFALLAMAVAGDVAETWMAFAVAFVVGSMSTVFDAGLQGYMPAVLDDDDLPRANAGLEFGRNVAMSAGFVVGGLVIAYAGGIAGALAFDAATYVVSVIAVLALVEVRPRKRAAPEPLLGAIRTGVSFLWRSAPLRWATGAAVLTNFAFAPLAAVMTLYAEEELGILEEDALGLFFAVFSMLAAAAAAMAPRLIRRIGTGRTVTVGALLFGVGAAAAGLVDGWWAVLPFGVATGGVAVNNAAFFTLRQVLTPADRLGRVISASRTAAWAGIPLGAFLGGLLGDAVGLRPLFVGGGSVIVLVGLALLAGPLGRPDATFQPDPVLD
jgi:MFS family permease